MRSNTSLRHSRLNGVNDQDKDIDSITWSNPITWFYRTVCIVCSTVNFQEYEETQARSQPHSIAGDSKTNHRNVKTLNVQRTRLVASLDPSDVTGIWYVQTSHDRVSLPGSSLRKKHLCNYLRWFPTKSDWWRCCNPGSSKSFVSWFLFSSLRSC